MKISHIFLVTLLLTHQAILGKITALIGTEQLQTFKNEHACRVLAFTKSTCPHCKKIKEPFAAVAHDPQLEHIGFAEIDLTKAENAPIRQQYQIKSVPYFVIESGKQSRESSTRRDNGFVENFTHEILTICGTRSPHTEIDTQAQIVTAELPTTYPFKLPKLAYAYNALEPHIDARTMQIHYEKHHQGYVDNLNEALKDHPHLQKELLSDILNDLSHVPENIRTEVRHNGGGHMNHSFFWSIMQPRAQLAPTGRLAEEINKQFGSFAAFKEKFTKTAKTVFGSGWAWLVTDKKGNLSIVATHNQDSPLSEHQKPILGLDVWEHAYYLAYQNRRMDYITAWWKVINWQQVEEYYMDAQHPKNKCTIAHETLTSIAS